MTGLSDRNSTAASIIKNMLLAAASLIVNGFGVYLTIHADIGAGPWDVFNLGLSNTFGILYGTASIAVSIAILLIDIAMKEPIGIAMFIDSIIVGKTVDLLQWLDIVPRPSTLVGKIVMILIGLAIMGYTQYFYMMASLGCGPRDTLMVGLKRRFRKIPIGVVSIVVLGLATFSGWLLGGQVGIGTVICAFAAGPIMQLAFESVNFDATKISHQHLGETLRILFSHRSSL